MRPEPKSKRTKRPQAVERPFPRRCRHCADKQVELSTIDYAATVQHDGRLHRFTVSGLKIPVCRACGQRVFTEQADAQINDALRSHLNLMMPAQIRDGIERVGLSQKETAQRLGIAEATLSRWLNETQIQSRAMDNLLRAFLAFPQMRTALCGAAQDPDLGLSDASE